MIDVTVRTIGVLNSLEVRFVEPVIWLDGSTLAVGHEINPRDGDNLAVYRCREALELVSERVLTSAVVSAFTTHRGSLVVVRCRAGSAARWQIISSDRSFWVDVAPVFGPLERSHAPRVAATDAGVVVTGFHDPRDKSTVLVRISWAGEVTHHRVDAPARQSVVTAPIPLVRGTPPYVVLVDEDDNLRAEPAGAEFPSRFRDWQLVAGGCRAIDQGDVTVLTRADVGVVVPAIDDLGDLAECTFDWVRAHPTFPMMLACNGAHLWSVDLRRHQRHRWNPDAFDRWDPDAFVRADIIANGGVWSPDGTRLAIWRMCGGRQGKVLAVELVCRECGYEVKSRPSFNLTFTGCMC